MTFEINDEANDGDEPEHGIEHGDTTLWLCEACGYVWKAEKPGCPACNSP